VIRAKFGQATLPEMAQTWYYLLIDRPSTGDISMSPTLKALGIDQLSVAQRILLVEEIWDSIVAESDQVPLTDGQKQDLERRLAAYEANPKAGSSWDEVKARLQRLS
jgi:putative addiction module component (TIGR02574 family)